MKRVIELRLDSALRHALGPQPRLGVDLDDGALTAQPLVAR